MATQNIDDKRYRKLEKLAVDSTIEQKTQIKTNDVIKSLIDQYLKELKPSEVKKYKKGE